MKLNNNSLTSLISLTIGSLKINLPQILRYFDYGLMLYFIFASIMGLVGACASLVECLSVLPYGFAGFYDSVLLMNNRGNPDNYGFINSGTPNTPSGPGTPGGGGFPPGIPGTHHTNVQIIHDDGSWSSGIRSLFIYGSGGARMWMNVTRGGTPSQQFFIVGTTILAESVSRLITNSLNDPSYIRTHIHNMRAIWQGDDSANVYLDSHAVQGTGVNSSSRLPGSSLVSPSCSSSAGETDEIAKSMIGVDIDLAKIYDSILSKIVNYLSYIFEPVQHSFTIDIMSNHIQNISILLFILTAIIFIFFISFLFNVTLFIFSDRFLSYFTNKYILLYLKFNKKFIAFEIIILSCWLGYLLYVLLTGLHYIATHPVIY